MMKNILYYTCMLFLATLLLSGCNKKEPMEEMKIEDCGVENPLDDLAWLSLQKDNCIPDIDCKTHFYSAVHNFKMVFYNQLVEGALCTPRFGVILYSCDGQEVKKYTEDERVLFENQVSDITFIYACE